MRSSSVLAPLFFAATSIAQAVPEGIAPSSSPPSGCETTANGNFTIGTLKFSQSSKRDTVVAAANGELFCNLKKGILRDSYGRTDSVVANHQFQFDGPPQAGAIYTGGFSICKNGSLAIGGTTRWYQCASGDFHNLYDESIGAQCQEIRIQAQLVNQPSESASASDAKSSAATPVVSVVSSLATVTGQVSTVSASAVGPTASLSRNSSATAGASSGASGASGASASSTRGGLSPGSSGAAGASSAAPAPPAGGAASASFSVAGSTVLGAAMAFIGGAAFLL